MQAAIRWSPHSTPLHQRFLVLNLVEHNLKLYQVEDSKSKLLKYKEVAYHTGLPACRAYDWSPAEEALVAFGQTSGEATLLRIDDISQGTISFPVKHQRSCNSVAFNKVGLLAAGLDKVRNDFCLNIWDVNQRLSTWNRERNTGWGGGSKFVEPIRRLVSGESITSIKFFPDQPGTLVTGAAGKYVRIYDLREAPGNPALQFLTKCVHNLSIDAKDPNYFASCAMGEREHAVCVWDRRGSPNQTGTSLVSSSANVIDPNLPSHILNYTNVVDESNPTYKSSIWSVRYCGSKQGTFGVLTSTGQLKIYETKQDYVPTSPGKSTTASEKPVLLRTNRIRDLEQPFYDKNRGRDESKRIISFDFMVSGDPMDCHRAITYRADGRIDIFPLDPPPPKIEWSSRGAVVIGKVETEKGAAEAAAALSAQRGMNLPRANLNTRSIDADGNGTDFSIVEPIDPEDETVAETLLRLRAKVEASRVEYEMRHVSLNETAGDGKGKGPASRRQKDKWTPHRVLNGSESSRYRHEVHALDAFLGPPDCLTVPEFLAVQEDVIQRRRCAEGYLFDRVKNQKIVADDPWLQDLWAWVQGAVEAAQGQGMVYGLCDLSFLGVWGVWNNNLGSSLETRVVGKEVPPPNVKEFTNAVTGINRQFKRVRFDGVQTAFPEHRLLCLAICGWSEPADEFEAQLVDLEKKGEYTKAAGWALFNGLTERAIQALQRGDKNMKLMSIAVAAYHRQQQSTSGENSKLWEDLTKELGNQLDDPYSRAIFSFVSNGDWEKVIREQSLPLRVRLGVALRFSSDHDLSAYIGEMTDEVINEGDTEGIVLTGITEQAVDLFEAYINKYNDAQTAVLVLAYASPLYFQDFRFNEWKQWYESTHDKWRLFINRCKFTVGHVKLTKTRDGKRTLPTPPRQISLRCNYCSHTLHRPNPTDAAAAATVESSSSSIAAERGSLASDSSSPSPETSFSNPPSAPNPTPPSGPGAQSSSDTKQQPSHRSIFSNNVVCPNCGRTLPRCVICMYWLGQPKPIPPGKEGKGDVVDPMEKYFNFCIRCNHGFHANHARDWFARHKACPVPECECTCASYRGGLSG